jgi:hypothetical protein
MRSVIVLAACSFALMGVARVAGQPPELRHGTAVPAEVREMYDRGLQYLARVQVESGDFPGGGQDGPGITGLGLLAMLASGEDPNFGPYALNTRRAIRSIIRQQDPGTGCISGNMYHHGFAMLALAEAYGAVDDVNLWETDSDSSATAGRERPIGQALELAVRGALTSQNGNPFGAWRYSPNARDADTSVSGAVLVGLLAARNAGIEVPDHSIERALTYYRQSTSGDGSVGYSGGPGGPGGSTARSSIATLIYAVARRKDLKEYQATLGYLRNRAGEGGDHNEEYTRYYQAQALYQGDPEVWDKWNAQQIRRLREAQRQDGSFPSGMGPVYGTSMSLLVLALNYRFLPIYER